MDRVLSDPAVSESSRLSKKILARYRSRQYSDGYRERYPNFENVARHLPTLRENLRRLHAAGVPVALGTDMWAFPGLGVSIEMDLYVHAGLSPLDALRAATRTAAQSLGVDADRGTLEAGKRADFLVCSRIPSRTSATSGGFGDLQERRKSRWARGDELRPGRDADCPAGAGHLIEEPAETGGSRVAGGVALAVCLGLRSFSFRAESGRTRSSTPGREWIVPDVLARGELLYRDVVYRSVP